MDMFTEQLLKLSLDEFLASCREAFLRAAGPAEEKSEQSGETVQEAGGQVLRIDAEQLMQDEVLTVLSEQAPIKYYGMLSVMAEEELKSAAERQQGGEAFSGLLEDYIRTERAYFEGLFRPECFTEQGMKWMAPDCQANDILVKFLDGGKKELKLVLEAAKLRSDLAQVMKVWLGCLN